MEELPIDTTIYSMSSEAPAEGNRRADERQLALFRVGAIVVGGRRELCLVKNVSAGGALIRAYCSLEPKQEIEIELKEGQPVPGRVSWTQASDAGIEFDAPVDILELLKTSCDGTRPRMPRVEISGVGFIREGAILHRTQLHNISQGGLNVEAPNPLSVGGEVMVSLPGLSPQPAVVRWRDGDHYGITFNNVLPLAGLVDWLHSRSCA